MFGDDCTRPTPDETIAALGKNNGVTSPFNRWTLNGNGYDEKVVPLALQKGKRYRLVSTLEPTMPTQSNCTTVVFELSSVYRQADCGCNKGRRSSQRLPEDRGGCYAGTDWPNALPL